MCDREQTGHCRLCGTACVDGDPQCDCWLPLDEEAEPEPREEEEVEE